MKGRKIVLSTLAAAVFATSAGALVACGDDVNLPKGTEDTGKTYTITFVAGEGATLKGITGTTMKTNKNGLLTGTMPTAEKTDYTFEGWALEASKDAVTIKAENFKTYVFSKDQSLYAVFAENGEEPPPAVEYDITFSGGAHGTVSKTTVKTTDGGKITAAMLPTVTPDDGWRFKGWESGGFTVTFPHTFDAKATVTATYEETGGQQEEQEYDITFENGDHGTVSATKVTTVDGVITTAMLPTVTPEEGWVHTGWTMDGAAVTFPKTFTATATITPVYTEEGEVPPAPEGPVVSVKNGTTEIELEDNSAFITAPSTATYEYKLADGATTIHLEAGDVLTILIDGESPAPNFNLYNSHGATYSGNTVTITATGDFTFYLRYFENGDWWNLEINDGETDELHVGHYYVVGAGFGWTCTAGGYIGATAGEIELTVGTDPIAFKVVKCENEAGTLAWDETTVALGPADVTTGASYVTTDKDGNIVLTAAGTYTVALVSGKLEITSDVEEPDPVTQGGTYKVGATGTEVALAVKTLTAEEQSNGMLAQYWIDTVQFNTGDKLYFAVDGAAIQFEVESASSGVETPEGTNNSYLEIKKGGTFKIYIKKFADKWQIYAGREIDPTEITKTTETVTANNAYLVGNVADSDATWDNSGSKGFKLTQRTDGMYEIIINMTSGDNFKFYKTGATVSTKTWIGTIGSSNVSSFIGTANDNLSIKADGNFYFIVDASAEKVYVSYSADGDPAAPKIEAPIEGGAYLVGQGFANAAWAVNPSNYIDPENGLEVTFTTTVQFKCLNCKNGGNDWAYNDPKYYECRNSDGSASNGLKFSSISSSGNGSVVTAGRYKITIEQKDGHILFVFTYLGAA